MFTNSLFIKMSNFKEIIFEYYKPNNIEEKV